MCDLYGLLVALRYGQKFKLLAVSLGGLKGLSFAAHFVCFLVPSRQHTEQSIAGLSDLDVLLRVILLRRTTGHHGLSVSETHVTMGSTVLPAN